MVKSLNFKFQVFQEFLEIIPGFQRTTFQVDRSQVPGYFLPYLRIQQPMSIRFFHQGSLKADSVLFLVRMPWT
jgi:hypothetical protein